MDPQPTTGDWPVVPPVPTPTRPGKLLPRPTPDVRLIPPLPGATAPVIQTVPVVPVRPRPRRALPVRSVAPSPTGSVIAMRRRRAAGPVRTDDLVWQPRFAYGAAAVTLVLYTVVTLPLWIVLYRQALSAAPSGRGLLALVMMLLGAMLVAVATWIILVEMRGRVRMVDSLARGGELATPVSVPVAPAPPAGTPEPVTSIAARVRERLNAAASASPQRAPGWFAGVLQSYGQRGAQLGLLAVALVLFLGATVLSLN